MSKADKIFKQYVKGELDNNTYVTGMYFRDLHTHCIEMEEKIKLLSGLQDIIDSLQNIKDEI